MDKEYKKYQFVPEQYIWLECIKKHKDLRYNNFCTEIISYAKKIDRQFLVNNFVVINMKMFSAHSSKNRFIEVESSLYTFSEWLRLYKKLCDKKTKVFYAMMIDLLRVNSNNSLMWKKINIYIRHPKKLFIR